MEVTIRTPIDKAIAIEKGADVLLIAVALSMGVLIVTSLFKTIIMISQEKVTKQ